MRWILLALAVVALLGLGLAFFWPEANPEQETSVKVSNALPPTGPAKKDDKAGKAPSGSDDYPTALHQPETKFDPIAFLEKCLERYDREVQGDRLMLEKQERIGGKLQKPEVIKVCFREHPYSVYMQWLKGARKAERALYVAGENNGMMLARPNGFLARSVAGNIVERDPKGSEAKQSGRYPITEFGMKKGMERTLAGWRKARARGALHVKYDGIFRVKELDNRECYKLHRYNYDRPEQGGVTDLTVYIDKETLLQTGSILKGEDGELIALYFFRDIHLNPEFSKDQFTEKALIP